MCFQIKKLSLIQFYDMTQLIQDLQNLVPCILYHLLLIHVTRPRSTAVLSTTIWEFLLISFFPFLYSNVLLQTRMWVMRFPVLKKIGDTALWGKQADFERTPELASSPFSQMLDSLYVFSECAFMLLPFHFCPTHDYILCAKHSFPQ